MVLGDVEHVSRAWSDLGLAPWHLALPRVCRAGKGGGIRTACQPSSALPGAICLTRIGTPSSDLSSIPSLTPATAQI